MATTDLVTRANPTNPQGISIVNGIMLMTLSRCTTQTLILALTTALAFTGCTKPKQTTAVSAAAGGAIGAGLGAIVGNQTGNAGSGVAIGAVAGAATGALIGNALQAQQEKLDSQKESIQRHEQTIRAQRSELEELRRMESDNGYSGTRTQSVNAYLVEQKRLQLQRRGPSPKGESISAYSPPPLSPRASEPLARYNTKVVAPLPAAAAASPVVTTPPKKAPTTSRIAQGIQEKDLASAAATQADQVEEASTDTTQAVPAKLAEKPVTTEGCQQSKEAREAAASTSDNSDKLLHLRKALRLCPNSAETHYEMGKTYLAMDRAADASYEFKQALSLNPNYTAAQESLKELDQAKAHY
jgi:tetratricopeptide (TPR) repeat protein